VSVPREHVCVLCESDCDRVTELRRQVRQLQDAVLLLSFALAEARELRDFARDEIECRFPEAA
jgi:hypothetical protein